MTQPDGVEIDLDNWPDRVILRQWLDGEVVHEFNSMDWPEINSLQYRLRQACVDAGITVRGPV